MKNDEARKRAVDALYKAWRDSDSFDHGGLASHEILDAVEDALRTEFKAPPRQRRT